MSLLNRMLQDLDARQGHGQPLTRWHDDVRPLPASPAWPLPRVILLLTLVGVLVAGIAYYAGLESAASSPPPVIVAAAPAAGPVPAVPAVPAATVPAEAAPVASEPTAVPLPAPTDDKPPTGDVPRPSATSAGHDAAGSPTPPASPPKKDAAVKGKGAEPAATAADVPRRKAAEAGTSALPVPPPATPSAAKPRGDAPPVIEKSDVGGATSGRAEQEYRKAIAWVNQGRIGEAVDGLRAALREDRAHIAARQLLVRLLLEARHGNEAMQTLQDGLQLLPAQAGWAMALARLQVERGDLSDAVVTLERSLPAGGANADYQGFAGHVLYRLGRHHEAADHYLVATRLAPAEGRFWLGLGLAYDAEGKVNEARDALLRAKVSGNLGAELTAVADQRLR